MAVGYSNQNALTRAMRRATGLTPAAWRRQAGDRPQTRQSRPIRPRADLRQCRNDLCCTFFPRTRSQHLDRRRLRRGGGHACRLGVVASVRSCVQAHRPRRG
ncbi:hypothetical protein [Pseudorhodoferax sp. Leaf267]|uniref:hypothetical protein n=1 Tax=Pseudorhodoferax sp. Leaf267 TaxID=1736316 RepID=UPI001F165627|nr:hypothetical protein [Pseudorhodoferax sp. Leaf267]